ncbi:RHS repeat-associated core domain-containing protein [Erythrobacter sp. JK5]|uniref:RHS repeat-associated core domain-containing protein n=1 Tax=Erythrobacter sp. JK5 TaxID=2829500 RepID=UPI001BA7C1D6|nr:RHS repeat-associated core domain-containing protein [Erythrobacter sp. JK5]QUL36893.1 RHS repeat-associated core domain-containing protein [Erythrobacter sp. JK5]
MISAVPVDSGIWGDTSKFNVRAEFIWAEPPAASDPGSGSGAGNPFGGGDHIAGYAPLALVAPNAQGALQTYWVHGNHLGVPLVTTDAQGSVVDPGNDFLRPGFPGQSQVLSNLYYNRNRDYDPVTGRYIQADPIGLAGDVNPYFYAGADPVNGIDPLGLFRMPAAPNPLLLRVAPQATVLYAAGLTLAAANQWALCRPMSAREPKDPTQIDYYIPRRSKEECDEQWEQAFEICEAELSKPNPSKRITGGHMNLTDCAKGYVDEECGGNRTTKFLDSRTPRPPGRHSSRSRKRWR